LATLFAILSLIYLGSGTSLSAQIGSGLNATETGTAIGGSTATDTLYADTTNQRWLMTNHNSGPYPVAAWPCTTEGCIVIGGTSQVGSYWTEQQLVFTNAPGVPLLQGSAIPQWGGTNASTAISLDLQNWALVSEVGNTTPATVVNLLAKIGTSGATKAGTGDTAIPTYIVAAGAGTSGTAQLVLAGQVNCVMENTVASSEGLYAIASTVTAGDCKAVSLSSIPFGTWIVGQVISASTTAASNALILVRPGYRELSTITGLSDTSGSPTTLATASGTVNNTHPAAWNSTGDLVDNQSPAMASPTMTTQSSGDNSTKGATTAYVRQEIQMTWSCHLSSATNNVATSCQWTLPAAVTFTQFDIHVVTAATTCSTSPVLALYDNTAGATIGSYSFTLSNTTNSFTAVTGSTSVVSGHLIVLKTTTAGSGCGTNAAGIDGTATYQMQN
jgi:hypothetical protein